MGREWSLFDLRDRCEQAARVGFRGIGLWHADLEHVLETRTLAEVKQLLDEHGLEHLELEFLGDWFLDPDDERRRASDERRASCCSRRRPSSRAHHIKVGQHPRHARASCRGSSTRLASSAPTPRSTRTRRSSTS